MKIISDIYTPFLDKSEKCCVTLGKFDGVHLGHQRLFEIMRREFPDQISVAFTFDFSIRSILSGNPAKNLFSTDEKRQLLEKQGIDVLVECPFSDAVRTMAPERFVKEILVDFLHVKTIVIGDDFHFGFNRQGDARLLEELADVYGYKFVKIEKVKDSYGLEIGSTRIRDELKKGNIEKVNELLGFPYFISGPVIHGKHLGESMGSPTINQRMEAEKLLPPFGVYFSRVAIGDRDYPAVTNIGIKPTVSHENVPGAETYIFEFEGNIYEQNVTTSLYCFSRRERNFENLSALKEQIHSDMNNAMEYWKNM